MKKPTNCAVLRRVGYRLFNYVFATAMLLGGIAITQGAAISVGSGGVGPITFTTIADTNGWTTANRLPNSGTAVTTGADLDNAVQTNTSPDIAVTATTAPVNAAVTADSANPPATSGTARWNSAVGAMATRPTGDAYNLLMAQFQNDSGGCINAITITYDMNTYSAATAELPGWHVFYSLTGAAGSWQKIDALSDIVTVGSVNASVTLSSSWNPSAALYLLWADDNGNGVSDPSYTIDNLVIGITPCNVSCVGITNQTGNITVPERGAATFSIMATGSPQTISWYRSDNGGASYTVIPGAISSTYTIPSVVYPGDNGAKFRATVSNSICQATSTAATLTVTPDATPPTALFAVGSSDLTTVTISFSEPVLTTGTPSDFSVYLTGGNPNAGLTTLSVTVSNATNIVLTTDARSQGVNYSVRIQNVTDTATTPNTISPNPTTVPVRSTIFVIDFDNDNVWKYSTQTNLFELDPTWLGAGYDDSGATWLSGPAALGVNTDANLNAVPIRTTTSYAQHSEPQFFRRHFFLPSVTNGVTLSMRFLFEDGGVVWINGQEAGRFNVGPGTLTAATRATANFTEGTATQAPPLGGPVPLPATNLVQGDNVIAVAIIQSGATSSDSILALELAAEIPAFAPPSCPGITANPQNVTFTQCLSNSATFSIMATGVISHYQWFRSDDGGGSYAPISGANSSTYTLNPAGIADSGAKFFGIVTNTYCSVTSTVATLTVIADTNPPAFLYVVGYETPTNIDLTHVTVVFNETIDTNTPLIDVPGNFFITDTNDGSNLAINDAVALVDGTGYIFTTDPRNPDHGYTITAQAFTIADRCAGNQIQNDITTFIYTYTATQLVLTASWQYLDNDVDPGAGWQLPGFNDSGWFSGPGPFDAKRNGNYPTAPSNCRSNTFYMMQGPIPTCIRLESPVTVTNLITANFRTHFNYTGKTNATLLQLSGKFDDGAIVYLNGVEVWRIGMPASGVTRTTFASRNPAVGDADGRDVTLLISSTNLHRGDNLLAVELHQVNLTSSDSTMGLEAITFTLEPAAPVQPPHLTVARSGNTVTVTWVGGGALQRSSNLNSTNNWVTIPGAASPFQTNTVAGGTPLFFQVKQ